MVCPEGCRHPGQAAPDTILKHLDHPLNLPIGLIVAKGDVVMDDTKSFAQPCKAAHKLGTIVGLDVAWFAPMGNQVISSILLGFACSPCPGSRICP